MDGRAQSICRRSPEALSALRALRESGASAVLGRDRLPLWEAAFEVLLVTVEVRVRRGAASAVTACAAAGRGRVAVDAARRSRAAARRELAYGVRAGLAIEAIAPRAPPALALCQLRALPPLLPARGRRRTTRPRRPLTNRVSDRRFAVRRPLGVVGLIEGRRGEDRNAQRQCNEHARGRRRRRGERWRRLRPHRAGSGRRQQFLVQRMTPPGLLSR